MTKMLKGLTFAAVLALSMVATTSDAFAKDARHGRETAWTLPAPELSLFEDIPSDGVTWE